MAVSSAFLWKNDKNLSQSVFRLKYFISWDFNFNHHFTIIVRVLLI